MSCKSSLWHIKVLLICLGALPSQTAFSPSTSLTSSRLNDSSLIYESATDYNKKRGRIRRISNTNLYDTPQQTEEPFFMQDVDNNMNAQQQDDMNGSSNSGGMDAYTQQMEQFAAAQDVVDTQIESPPPPPMQNESTESTTNTNNNKNNEPAISNVDARVLESILQDGKLDLSSEYEAKKLLEGPRLQENEDYPTSLSDEDQKRSDKYSSKFVKSVSDNAFWNSIKAKGEELIDSAAIYIANRIERDTKTLAAVGLFTFDRIRKDIGRALPAAGRATRQLLLSSNSTYAERLLDVTDQTPFALPSDRSLTNRDIVGSGYDELYEDLTTPADEIRSVTSAILDILSGKEIDYDQSSSARRSVKSFAPAGTSRMAERQKRAYTARKQTVLKREKEGIDRKVGRAIGSVSDATWEFRREMQTTKGREAGYRSKGVRKALASGATQLLEAGRESSRRLLSNGSESSGEQQVEIVNDVDFGQTNFVDVSPMEEEEIIENVIEEMTLDYAPDGLLSPQSYVEEKRRLISSLESCLSQPSETWLTKEAVAEAAEYGVQLDGDILREVITNMVTLRDQLQKEMEEIANEQVDLKMEFVQTDLRRMKQMVDSVSSLSISAAGQSAANLLKQELEGFVLSDTIDDIIEIELERLEQLLAEEVAAREEEIRARRQRQQQKLADQQRYMDTVVESEVVDQSTTASQGKWNGGMYTEVEVVNDNTGYQGNQDYQTSGSRVEVVSDTEYTEYEQQFKSAQSAIGDEVVEDQDDNPVADLALRVLDVIFFVGEKVFLVLLPDLISGGGRVTSRYAQAQSRGRGTVGWKQLENIKTKNIR